MLGQQLYTGEHCISGLYMRFANDLETKPPLLLPHGKRNYIHLTGHRFSPHDLDHSPWNTHHRQELVFILSGGSRRTAISSICFPGLGICYSTQILRTVSQ